MTKIHKRNEILKLFCNCILIGIKNQPHVLLIWFCFTLNNSLINPPNQKYKQVLNSLCLMLHQSLFKYHSSLIHLYESFPFVKINQNLIVLCNLNFNCFSLQYITSSNLINATNWNTGRCRTAFILGFVNNFLSTILLPNSITRVIHIYEEYMT